MAIASEKFTPDVYSESDIERMLHDCGLWEAYNALGSLKPEAMQALISLAPLLGSSKEDLDRILQTYKSNRQGADNNISYNDSKPKTMTAGAGK